MSIIKCDIEHDDILKLLLLENIDRYAFNISNIEVEIYKKYDKNIYILSFDFDYDNYRNNTIKDFIDYIKSDKNIKINKIKKYKFHYKIKLSKILSIEDLYNKNNEIKMIKNNYRYEVLYKKDDNLYYEYKHYNQLNPNISYKFKISYEKENNEYRKIYILLYKKYNLNFKNIIDLKIDLIISDKIKETEEISKIIVNDKIEVKLINDKQIINIFNHFQYNKFTKDILYNLFLKDKNNKIKYIQTKYENLIYKLKIIHNQLNLINFIL